jgi:hypothetical protein
MEGTPPPQGPPPPEGEGEQELTPEQLEYLQRMEEEMRKVRVQDLVTQSAVSILNLTARRIAKEDERDLEQARVGIEAVRALVDLLDAETQREVRNALSQVQLMYAEQTGGDAEQPQGGAGSSETGPKPGAPGSSGLWTPGSG